MHTWRNLLKAVESVGMAVLDGTTVLDCNDAWHSMTDGIALEHLMTQDEVSIARGGATVWYRVRTTPLENSDREPIGRLFIVTDISLERQQQARAEEILESMQDGFFDWHIRDDTMYMSPRFWAMLGFDASEKPRHPTAWMAHVHPEDIEPLVRCIEQHMQCHGAPHYTHTARFLHKDGRTVYIKCRGRVLERASDGAAVRLVGTHTDVTHEQDMSRNAELAEIAKRVAEEALRDRQALVNYVFHEVRNPVNVLSTGLEVLQMELDAALPGSIPEAISDLLVMMQRSLVRATCILNDTLDYSKLESGTFQLDMRPHDLSALVRELCTAFESMAADARLDFALHTPTQAVMCTVDEYRICQVVQNLLTNAIKFTAPGGQVSVLLRAVGSEAVLEVSDTGCGIMARDLVRIFQPYNSVQAGENNPAMSSGVKGMGLGLCISRKIMHAHGGNLTVSSDVNKGSTFIASVPLQSPVALTAVERMRRVSAAAPSAPFAVPKRTVSSLLRAKRPIITTLDGGTLTSPRLTSSDSSESDSSGDPEGTPILLVDDDPLNRRVMQRLLDRHGYRVATLKDGAELVEAVEAGRAQACACILLDELMPRMNGSAALRVCRQEYGLRTPVVILTGCATPDTAKLFTSLNVADVLHKPINAARLLACVDGICGMPQRRPSTGAPAAAAVHAQHCRSMDSAMPSPRSNPILHKEHAAAQAGAHVAGGEAPPPKGRSKSCTDDTF